MERIQVSKQRPQRTLRARAAEVPALALPVGGGAPDGGDTLAATEALLARLDAVLSEA